jgi:hypothetical protein
MIVDGEGAEEAAAATNRLSLVCPAATVVGRADQRHSRVRALWIE